MIAILVSMFYWQISRTAFQEFAVLMRFGLGKRFPCSLDKFLEPRSRKWNCGDIMTLVCVHWCCNSVRCYAMRVQGSQQTVVTVIYFNSPPWRFDREWTLRCDQNISALCAGLSSVRRFNTLQNSNRVFQSRMEANWRFWRCHSPIHQIISIFETER